MSQKKTEIFSIFGQCEAVVAEMMVDEGKLTKIHPSDIPFDVARDELGRVALLAVVVPAKHLNEFNNRCSELRA